MQCPRCQLWEVRESDNYCGWCQRKFVDLDVEMNPSRFVQAGWPPPACLTLTNRSPQHEIEVYAISATREWIAVDLEGVSLPFTLGPGEQKQLSVQVDPLAVGAEYATGRVVVASNAGPQGAEVEVAPPPEIRITTGEYEIFLDNLDLEQTYARVEVEAGIVTILGVSAEPADWASVRPVEQVHFPVTLDARNCSSIELRLLINEEYLLHSSTKFPAVYDGRLRVSCLDFEREEPFRIRCWRPPQMWIWEESEPRITAYAGKRGQLTLSVQNKAPGDPLGGQGNAALEVRSIEIRNPDGTPNTWLQPLQPISQPVRIQGGELRQFRFAFDTEGSAPGAAEYLPVGRHSVVLAVSTNMCEPVHEVRFEVNVVQMPIYDGVLALDFGTSNTCCAVQGRREDRFVLLKIDSPQHNPQPTTTPTMMQYIALLDSGEKVVEIGALVQARFGDPHVVGSTVRSFKRALGDEAARFEVTFPYTSKQVRYTPREVVADYLTRVRLRAEEEARAVFKRIIVTHPARFRMRQLRELEAAVRDAFGPECEISLLQEPVAAALNFVVSEEALSREAYTLGVFDFGGGSTDLSLLRVDNIRQSGFVEIRARLVSSTGRWFGGENLTDFVLQRGLDRCRAIVHSLRSQAEILTDPRQALDPSTRWYAKLNQFTLQRWAEESKLLLVAYGDQHIIHLPVLPGVFPSVKLSVLTASGVEELAFPHTEIVPRLEELNAYLEEELCSLARMLKGLVERGGQEGLDYLLLSGKSASIPLVREVLAREFPETTLRMAGEPKECVVAGACILEKFQDAPDIFLNLEATAATTSRIGLEDRAKGIFLEWVPAGVPIPEGGLLCQRSYLLRPQRGIRLLENAGEETALYVMGRENPDISELGIYVLEKIPDWLPENRPVPITLELRLSPSLDFTLSGRIEGCPEVLTFRRLSEPRAGY
jgi:hypothetical protein